MLITIVCYDGQATEREENMELEKVITVKNLCLYYGEHQALKNISLDMYKNKVVRFYRAVWLRQVNFLTDLKPYE